MDNRLQMLLERYREGTLTDSERSELERMSHKEEVFSAARSRATGIIRRRVALTVSAIMICGAGIWAVLPGGGSQMSQVAKVVAPIPKVPQEVRETLAPEVPAEPAPMVAEVRETPRSAAVTRKVRPADVAPTPEVGSQCSEYNDQEPVVVCNSQCDADSVISDIKKFLCAI